MIALTQRVTKAQILIKNKNYSSIKKGFVILLGILKNDSDEDVSKLVNKIINLRIISDEKDKMNLSIKDINGEILVVSQFTLCADLTGGRRPSFINAKNPDDAYILYKQFVDQLEKNNIKVKTGSFGEYMEVQIFNDGPVTVILDSKKI